MSVGNSDRRPTKAERKEQARIEREEIERRQASRRRNRLVSLIVGVVIAGAVVGLVLLLGGNSNPTPSSSAATAPGGLPLPDPATLPGVLRTAPPWSNNVSQANERLAMLGLPGLSDTVLHHHARLWIYVDGQPVEVPAEVGYSQQANVFSPLHTHDATGTVHIESADPNFEPVLAQFMDVWGVYFTPTCLGDACASGDRQLRVFVNGKPYTGDPTQLPLNDEDAIVVTMGTSDQVPDPIPDKFTFGGNG